MLLICMFAGTESLSAQERKLPPDSMVMSVKQELKDSTRQLHLIDSVHTKLQVLPDTLLADSFTLPESLIVADSLTLTKPLLLSDSLAMTDSVSVTTDTIPRKKSMIEAQVIYQATDSVVLTAGNMAYLYGKGDVKYQQIQLQAEHIQMNMDSSIVFAKYAVDSLGVEFGYPLFIDGQQQVESKAMRYNFRTKKGLSIESLTQQGDGFLTARVTKKMTDNTMNILDGQYTTCDEHDHPHFYIQLTRAKTRPGKNLVAGPAYLVIEDVPLYFIGLPFAFFPFTQTYSSGILMPTYGEDMTQGFFLRDMGYYFALNDYLDLAVRGDLYTKGSWGLSARSSYKKRYKYSGGIDAAYIITKTGDKGFDDYSVSKSFKINWTHQQDPKSNPFRTFSASVNFMTNQFDYNNIKNQGIPQSTENTKGSSINITQRFPNSPWNISASMNINQTMRDSSLYVMLPTLSINMGMTAPFKRKNAIGPERWYEKIKISYSGRMSNSLNSKENVFLQKNIIRDWTNGMTHQIPVSASYTALNYINITPSFNYQERWLTKKELMSWDDSIHSLVTDTTLYGFYRVYNWSASVSAGTTFYGFYKPWPVFGGFINTIRHRIEPSIAFSYAPGYGDPKYGFYQNYSYIRNGVEVHDTYSPYSNSSQQFGGLPNKIKQGNISFSISNNLEAKVRSKEDSTGFKKISLIDNLSLSTAYNLAADSMNWSDINASIRMKLSKSYTLNLSGSFDVYTYNSDGTRINVPRWAAGKGFGRLRGTGTSLSYTFDNNFLKTNPIVKTVRKLFGLEEPEGGTGAPANRANTESNNETTMPGSTPETPATGTRLRTAKKSDSGDYDADGYYKATVPWSLNVSYGMQLGYGPFNKEKLEYDYIITNSLSFSGSIQPTPKWRINYNGSYDFKLKKIPYFTLNISREMHCFTMTASVVPVGMRKTYTFSIAVSSSLLKDLKYDQSSSYWNSMRWY